MSDEIKYTCRNCGNDKFIYIEYSYGSPNRYDGWSERMCDKCEARYGRWTDKQLLGNESEPRFGGK